MNHFTKQKRSLGSQLHRRKGIQINSSVSTSKEKNEHISFKKKTSATKQSPTSNVFDIEFNPIVN